MAREFAHVDVTFQRQVTQQQTVTVKSIDAALPRDLQQQVARSLAEERIKDKAWENTEVGEVSIVE